METDGVPEDFPLGISAVVPGAQPKLCVVRRAGLYVADQEDDARRERWLMCEDLASQLVSVAVKDDHGRPVPHEETLHRIRLAVARKGWVSMAELDWLIKRLRELLAW
ncbi:hypothetical protein SAMN04487926_11633 [Paraburkholderia steynii]|uniref:Uncharacterized protein n=1 Tax=Paraburkholderia steynii TaxID=1245441 RepID=A0A7Z7BA52_9BURK|nr:hypothetical protein [Paraburkholderia steynii]SDI38950.1 hypothetical protein SAMN04487926_11633 [Paraburkholderia steynii]